MVVTAVDDQYKKQKGMLQVSKNAGIVTNKSARGPKAGIQITRLQKNEKPRRRHKLKVTKLTISTH